MMQLNGEKLYWQVFQPEVQKSVEKHFLGFGKNKKKSHWLNICCDWKKRNKIMYITFKPAAFAITSIATSQIRHIKCWKKEKKTD